MCYMEHFWSETFVQSHNYDFYHHNVTKNVDCRPSSMSWHKWRNEGAGQGGRPRAQPMEGRQKTKFGVNIA